MVWQEVARNLASREEKVYERTQDGMSPHTQSTCRCIVAVLLSLDDYIDEHASMSSLLWLKTVTF
jgi:hypothetical protein